MNRILAGTALLVLVGLSGALPQAQAANLTQFRDTASGNGSIRLPKGRTDQLRRAEVEFQRGGVGSVRLIGDRTYQFNGRWTNGSGQRLEFRITRALNDDEPGDATIRFRGDNELTEITLTSRARGGSYIANFKTDRGGDSDDGWNGGGSIREFRGSRDGRGTLKVDRRDDERLRQVTVDLRRGGDATITVDGRDDHSLKGRWRTVDSRTAEVRLDDIFGDRGNDTKGRARIRFAPGGTNRKLRLDRVEANGRWRDRDFTLDFDPDGGGNGGGNQQPGDRIGVTSTRTGTGNLTVGGRRDEFLKEARIRLEPNGDATLRFTTNEASFTVEGKWFKRRNTANTVDIDISRYGDTAATGRGTIELALGSGGIGTVARTFSRIELNGQTGGSRLAVSFRAQ